MIEVVASRPTHVGPIAVKMRAIDVEECLHVGLTPKGALRQGLSTSETCWTVKLNGVPVAMFGVVPVSAMEGRGRVWMLMTNDAMKHRRAILRMGRIYTEALQRHYRILENYVHAENEATIRWLSRLGYVVGAIDVIRGVPVRYFVRLG